MCFRNILFIFLTSLAVAVSAADGPSADCAWKEIFNDDRQFNIDWQPEGMHVFVPHTDDDAEQTINEVLKKHREGTGMTSLISEYNQDPAMTEKGIFILDGYMTNEYENVAFSLEIGQTSDIVVDDNGYYFIERLQTSPADIMLDFDNLKKTYQTYTFYSMIDKKQSELTFIPNEACIDYMSDPFAK